MGTGPLWDGPLVVMGIMNHHRRLMGLDALSKLNGPHSTH